MQSLVESFLESDFDSSQVARQKRDARLAELSAQGYACRVENLTTIHTGLRIFFVIAQPTTEMNQEPLRAEPQPPSMPAPQLRNPKSGKLQFDDRSRSTQTDHPRSHPEESRRSQPQDRLRPNLRDCR